MQSSIKSLSLYIHWPYCLSKCPYCDFASQACTAIDEENLWSGYQRDIEKWLGNFPIGTIFFGGGTPSLMSISLMDRLMNEICRHTTLLPDCEITLEANPDAITATKMADFKRLGVNRLSLGVQSLNATDLAFLGRRHTVQTALKRIEEGQRVFDRVNIDLIYARPNQTPDSWQKELTQALSLGLKHYSLYQLTIEDKTPFAKKGVCPADEETAVCLYRLTDEIMQKAGIPAYEVSNYATPGQECHHNMAYWLGNDYVGIGPAAHGRIGLNALQNPRSVKDWLGQGTSIEKLTHRQKMIENLLMGLRLRQHDFPIRGLPLEKIQKLVNQGLLIQGEKGIRPTLSGVLVLDRLILELLPD